MTTTRQLGRGALYGLVSFALVGAAALQLHALTLQARCEGLTETECAFEEQVVREAASKERLAASGLGLLGAGGAFFVWSKRRRPE